MKNVIFVIPGSPNYNEWANKLLPENNVWRVKNGELLYIEGTEFGDLLLKALVEYYPNYNCEVWQQDPLSDKIYTAHLQNGLVHRNFPAKIIKVFKRYKYFKYLYSRDLLILAKCYDSENTIFMIDAQFYKYINVKLINTIKKSKILFYHFLNSKLLLPDSINNINPLKIINNLLIRYNKIRWLKGIKNLLTSNNNPEALNNLKKIFPIINIFLFEFGLDCDYWRPVVDKVEARRILNIPQYSFVILLSQRLVPEYQVDKFIECLTKVKAEREFICYITGHGTLEYESYLNEQVIKHKLEEKVHFVGYVEDDVLRNYFIAADLFVTVPYMFAGSYGAVKCMAIGTPILHVNMGDSYEFLKKHNAGEFVSPYDYDEWAKKLEDIINGKIKVKTVPREELVNYYSWKRTADDLNYALMNLT